MQLKLTRKTGFFGMGSPLVVRITQEQKALLNHQQTVQLELPNQMCTVQVTFFLLKSPVYQVHQTTALEVTMNPKLLLVYLLLFALMFLLPVMVINPWSILVILIFYGCWMRHFFRQAYLIKECEDRG
ncbi:MAG: hypothetical protein ACK5MW_00625 [Enterococcus sp.]